MKNTSPWLAALPLVASALPAAAQTLAATQGDTDTRDGEF